MHHGCAPLATALILALMVATPAEAQRAARPAGAERLRLSATALEAARRFLCPNGGMPQRVVAGRRGGRCTPAPGGSVGGGDDSVPGWDQGLPAANRAQAPCPPGTVATSSAQTTAVRCLPG